MFKVAVDVNVMRKFLGALNINTYRANVIRKKKIALATRECVCGGRSNVTAREWVRINPPYPEHYITN